MSSHVSRRGFLLALGCVPIAAPAVQALCPNTPRRPSRIRRVTLRDTLLCSASAVATICRVDPRDFHFDHYPDLHHDASCFGSEQKMIRRATAIFDAEVARIRGEASTLASAP